MIEEEAVIKGYDPKLAKRLLALLKPYKLTLVIAAVALVFATAGQLIIPVILQRSVDNHLMRRYHRVPAGLAQNDRLANLEIDAEDIRIGDFFYVPDNRLVAVSGVQKDRLIADDFLSEERYYVFDIQESSPQIVERYRDTLSVGERYASLPFSALEELGTEELREIRAPDLAGLARESMVFLLTLIVVLVATFGQVYLMALTGQRIMRDLRLRLFDHTIHQSLRFLSGRPVGKLVTRATNDVETINELFTNVLVNLLRNLAMMLGTIVTLFAINARLGVVAALTLPPVLIGFALFRGKARDAFRRVRQWVSRVNGFLSEHLSGMSVVQMFVMEKRTREQFHDQNEKLMRANLGEMYVFAVFRPLVDLFSTVSIAIIIFFGARFLVEGIVSLGVLIAFINLVPRFYRPLMEVSETFNVLQSAMAGSERVFELLDEVQRVPDTGKQSLAKPVKGLVEFDHVEFAYKQDEPVIRDLSFTVRPGETVAIVGYTGAGKTTIANLLTRLWDIDKGSIRLDGVDIREIPLSELRTHVQPIQQDVFLFSDTVRENMLLGLELGDEDIRRYTGLAQAEDFVEALPSGYDTHLAEGAANISTGQRQLLSFARVLAHDPRVIILDEATSSIDTETEKRIQTALKEVLRNRTSLVIAHRLSTIKDADRILVLSAGKLIEEGNHDELIRLGGVYYNLYRLQYDSQAAKSG